jgi:hypothetical protein
MFSIGANVPLRTDRLMAAELLSKTEGAGEHPFYEKGL